MNELEKNKFFKSNFSLVSVSLTLLCRVCICSHVADVGHGFWSFP